MYKSEQLNLRLSPREAEIVEAQRGGLSKSAYVRSLIVADGLPPVQARNAAGDALSHAEQEVVIPPTIVVESPLTEEPIEDYVPQAVVEGHRHRRGKKIGEEYIKGTLVETYSCATPGCTRVL